MNKPDSALVSTIQHFSIDDGEGIRTTVFLQGCPLHCRWCHNPEAIPSSPVLLISDRLCTKCGLCGTICPNKAHTINADTHLFDRTKCGFCGLCTGACENNALTLSGRVMSAEEVFAEIYADYAFYKDGGGATLSGGEPLLQNGFCKTVLSMCKNAGINTAIETCGNVEYSRLQSVITLVDRFFFDIKGVEAEAMKAATGADLDTVYGNLKKLIKENAKVTVSLPVIPGYSDSTEYMIKAVRLLSECDVTSVRLLPFHRYGFSKYESMGIPNECAGLKPPDREKMFLLSSVFPKEIKVEIRK